MTYEIVPTDDFIKDFKKIDSFLQKKVKKKFDEVSVNPTRYKHMKPPWNNYCRIRIDKLRIIFRYEVSTKKLFLNKIVFKHKY